MYNIWGYHSGVTKIQVFWDVTLCLPDVSKHLSALTFEVKQASLSNLSELMDPKVADTKILQNAANYFFTDTV